MANLFKSMAKALSVASKATAFIPGVGTAFSSASSVASSALYSISSTGTPKKSPAGKPTIGATDTLKAKIDERYKVKL